jgi:phosphohistidine swiveling domain-containing protein
MKPHSTKIVVEESGVNYFAWSIITDAFFKYPYYQKYIGKPLTLEIMLVQNSHGRWAVDVDNLLALTRSSLRKLETGTYAIREIHKLNIFYGQRVLAGSDRLKIYLGTSKKTNLWRDLEKNWSDFLHLNGVGTVLVWTDIDNNLLTEKLKNILSSREVGDDKLQEHLSLLLSQVKPGAQWRQELDLLQIAVQFKTYKRTVASREFQRHCEKYRWIQYGYHGPEVKRVYFSKLVKRVFHGNVVKALRKHVLHFEYIKKEQRILERTLILTTREKQLFTIARRIMYLKAYRVDVRYYFHWVMDMIFKQLSKEFKIPFRWFIYAERDEIINLIKGKSVNLTSGLQKSEYLLRVKNGKTTRFYNKTDGSHFLKHALITEAMQVVSEIKGNVAYIGKVTGIVRIVYSRRDIAKVKKGDILVALATNPDLLPAMSRAGAFITDAGGITSHAAIVAREMKKPCIIGTKIATRVLKDGDVVEVDALKGIIKKLR